MHKFRQMGKPPVDQVPAVGFVEPDTAEGQ